MKRWSSPWIAFCAVLAVTLGAAIGALAAAGSLRVDIQLVWGSNDEKSPDPKQKPVDEALAKRLAQSPFKWRHYFEVNRVQADVSGNQAKQVKMSEHCVLDIKSLGGNRVEIKLQGDGRLVSTHVETLQDDWPLILSGNAKNNTAWLVVIQKVSDKKAK